MKAKYIKKPGTRSARDTPSWAKLAALWALEGSKQMLVVATPSSEGRYEQLAKPMVVDRAEFEAYYQRMP